MTYEQDPSAHLQTEYAFDVDQVAQGNYAPEAYHDFIGFNVAKPLLQRAFLETYGFELGQVIDNVDEAIGSYRHTLSTLIPFFTRVAWANHQKQIQHAQPGVTKRQFLYVIHRSSYEREWGKQYDRPSFFDRIVAFILKILPPIGRIKVLKFRSLTPQVEQLFMKSFDQAAKDYHANLDQAGTNAPHIANTNFDTGAATKPGQYSLQDETYAYWLNQLAKSNFGRLTPEVKKDILAYYQDPDAAIPAKTKKAERQQILTQLGQLKTATAQDQNSSLSPN